jgi:uncharacterized protein YndB with AHSA1/START domain
MPILQMEPPQTEAAIKLIQTRILRAPRPRVYEAWTNPEAVQRWFGPGNRNVSSATLDVREGGKYRIEMRGTLESCMSQRPNQDRSHLTAAGGTYTRVVPNELLQFTWTGDWNPSETTLVTVSLKDFRGDTEITLQHERFVTEDSRDRHQHGWGASLDKLAELLEPQ